MYDRVDWSPSQRSGQSDLTCATFSVPASFVITAAWSILRARRAALARQLVARTQAQVRLLLLGRQCNARVRHDDALLASPRLGNAGQIRAARRRHTWGGAGRAVCSLIGTASAREAVASGVETGA